MSIISTSTGEFQQVQVSTGLRARFEQLDQTAVRLMARYGITALRISMGLVYIWFGALKMVHGLSPIEAFIRETMPFLPGDLFLPFLAIWEMAIGLGFITGKFPRITVMLMLAQMGGAMSPFILRPDLLFTQFPYAFTLVGQYIFKDIILISAALVIGATARGGKLVSDPRAIKREMQ